MKPLAIRINPALNRDVTPNNSAQIACDRNCYSEPAPVSTFIAQTTFTTAFPYSQCDTVQKNTLIARQRFPNWNLVKKKL
jgi:hypothetical protein